jgi:ketosteroid isomerase-like protein
VNAAAGTPKEVVREFVARLGTGRSPWLLLAESAVVTVNGTTPLSGRYAGLSMVRGILVDTATDVIERLDVAVDELIGMGTRVAALLKVSGRSTAGVEFNTEGRLCGCVFGVRDGLIDEVIFYPDTSLVEIALYGRRYVSDG